MCDFDAPPFAYNIWDRCVAEGKAACLAGVNRDACPYPYQAESDVEFEREAWLNGYTDPNS